MDKDNAAPAQPAAPESTPAKDESDISGAQPATPAPTQSALPVANRRDLELLAAYAEGSNSAEIDNASRRVRAMLAAPQPSLPAQAGEAIPDGANDDRAMFPARVVRELWALKERYRLASSRTAAVVQDERAAFEAWASGKGICTETFEDRTGQLLYIAPAANDGWQAWQARAASPQAKKSGGA